MLVDVIMPKLGESITEGTIIEWRKQLGDEIGKDEALLDIGTDKVDSEIPSPAVGVVVEILAQPNDVIPVGETIARIETDSDAAVVVPSGEEESQATAEIDEGVEVEPEPADGDEPEAVIDKTAPTARQPREKRQYYTPLVRSIARKENIAEDELAALEGSGRGGRVTKADILAYLKAGRMASVSVTPAPGLKEEVVELSRMRQIIAEHMRLSLDTSAHTYLISECDVSGIVEYVTQEKDRFLLRESFELTYTPFFIQAAVRAIEHYPIFNASLDGTTIHHHRNINIGLAVALEESLMVPVIKNCEELNFLGICRKTRDLAQRARSGNILPDELQGSTFSITNYGVFGNILGTPIINQPNAAILGVGAVKKKPVVRESEHGDAIVVRSMVYLSLGLDHRLIDGSGGGRFLQRMVDCLENLNTSVLL